MNRLLELVFILLLIIIVSTMASSLTFPRERFDGANSNIDAVSTDLGNSGMCALSGSPTSIVQSFVKLVPTLDDLLSSSYLRPEYTQGLTGTNNITSRTCSDMKGTLAASMDSNKTSCSVLIDLQAYSFRATGMKLKVSVPFSKPDTLAIVTDKAFLDLLLRRPVFFTIEDSQPYSLDLSRNTPTLFTTAGIPTINTYNTFPQPLFSLPIKTIPATSTNFFPAQTKAMMDILNSKMAHATQVTGSSKGSVVEVNIVIYYVVRQDQLGNALSVPENTNTAYFTADSYIQSIVGTIQSPVGSVTVANVQNPVFSLTFTINVQTPSDLTNPPWWVNDWHHMVMVGSDQWGTCDNNGRGILLVEMRPQAGRTSNWWNWPYAETPPASGRYYCLDFTNVERNNTNNTIVDACGGYNRANIWLPTGTPVDIAYIISPSMKVIVARYYDASSKKRQMTFVHEYNTGSNVNDIYQSLIGVNNLCVQNLCRKTNLDPTTFSVTDIELSYGMIDLYNWFNSS